MLSAYYEDLLWKCVYLLWHRIFVKEVFCWMIYGSVFENGQYYSVLLHMKNVIVYLLRNVKFLKMDNTTGIDSSEECNILLL